ncbi:MAG: hypothetical protein WA948_12565 [Pontixanthobacter sp.]
MTFKRALALTPVFVIACCTPAAPPAPAPAPVVTRPAPPPLVVVPQYDNWLDAPQTPGDWRYSNSGSLSYATFGLAGEGARFGIECRGDTNRIRLVRASSSDAGATMNAPLVIRTETATRAVPATSEQAATSQLAADMQPRDPLLDAMALSRGRFAIETAGMETLYLPAWPEVTRVIEDCR